MQFLEKFGHTLLFAFFILMLLIGLKMLLRVVDPYTRKVSASLADTLGSL